ncbi:MAG: hypothetical protein JO112_20845, partial [Planctomycetes bacterium]|nr:hypothetical protein [Planctomycetota bacterium]
MMDARQLSSGATSPGPLRLLSSPAELDKSAVLDDAYEEYCRRREQGELPDPDQFVEKYPT